MANDTNEPPDWPEAERLAREAYLNSLTGRQKVAFMNNRQDRAVPLHESHGHGRGERHLEGHHGGNARKPRYDRPV
ncbi:MAG TPA: hypothetical protein VFA43_10700 [Gemmatimonadaceae bacterium]|nr:hypothetical protein [Gemmatimonadaceae bacterium]